RRGTRRRSSRRSSRKPGAAPRPTRRAARLIPSTTSSVRVLPPLVLGLWLGGLVASWVAAATSFRTVERVLGESARPELLERLQPLRAEERRTTLRHLASEINRALFVRWAPAQLALGALLVALVWGNAGAARACAAAALVLVLVQIACVAPI